MICRSVHISPLVRIHRPRMLAGNAHVLVQDGQKVKFGDVIARGAQPGNYILLDLKKALGISSKEKIAKAMQRHAGESLQKGDIIARTQGFASRIVRAQGASRIISIENGTVLLEVESAPLELKANYSGTVTQIIPDRGAVISGDGALIQGVWSNGKSGGGLLASAPSSPEQEFTRASLDVSQRGSVWISGFCLQEDAMRAAGEMALRGLILSSMSASLIPFAAQLPFPVILLEGFGKIPMNESIFKLLSTNSTREVSISSDQTLDGSDTRPEIFLPLPTEANAMLEDNNLEIGKRVRANMAPYTGKSGTVSNLKNEPVSLPSHINTICAEVSLANDQRIIVPVDNLEIIL